MTKPPAVAKPKTGRPPAKIDLDAVERAASIGCTAEEIAAIVGVGRRTLFDHMERDPEITAAIERGKDKGRATLRRMQWQGAQKGNATMLIWLGKQMLGQKDRHEIDLNTPVSGADDAALIAIATAGGGAAVTPEEVPHRPRNVVH